MLKPAVKQKYNSKEEKNLKCYFNIYRDFGLFEALFKCTKCVDDGFSY